MYVNIPIQLCNIKAKKYKGVNIMIINSHAHVNTDRNYFFYNDYDFYRLLEEMFTNKIDLVLPTLNPKLEIFRCPNDCSIACPSLNGRTNFNLNNCSCTSPKRHRVCITEKKQKIALFCKTCGKLILESDIDPLRKYNIYLINQTKPYRQFIKPILYLSLCRSTLQREINFFEKNFSGEFVGFKLHPWNDQVNVADFKVNTAKPILIHTGIRSVENALNAITFAENNPNLKIVIAHSAFLNYKCLEKIAKNENIFVDCCPSTFMFENKSSCFLHPETLSCPEDIYYKVLSIVPSDKILFGSDSPWGNVADELRVVRNLKISKNLKEQILYGNAERLYQL